MKDENAQFLQLFAYILQNMQQYNALQNDKNEAKVTNTTQKTQSDLNLENNTTKETINTIQNNLANIQQQIIEYIFKFKPEIINQLKDIINNNIDDDSINESNNNKINDRNNDIILNKGHKLLILLLIVHHFTQDDMLDSISSNITYHTLKKTLNDILNISCKGITLENKNYDVKTFTFTVKNALYQYLIDIVYNHAELCRKIFGDFFLFAFNESEKSVDLNKEVEKLINSSVEKNTINKSDKSNKLSDMFFQNIKYKNICNMTISKIKEEKNILENFNKHITNMILGTSDDYYKINFQSIKNQKENVKQLLNYFDKSKNANNKNNTKMFNDVSAHISDLECMFKQLLYTLENSKNKNSFNKTKYKILDYVNSENDQYKDLENVEEIYIAKIKRKFIQMKYTPLRNETPIDELTYEEDGLTYIED